VVKLGDRPEADSKFKIQNSRRNNRIQRAKFRIRNPAIVFKIREELSDSRFKIQNSRRNNGIQEADFKVRETAMIFKVLEGLSDLGIKIH
jgi:hypothetical protein